MYFMSQAYLGQTAQYAELYSNYAPNFPYYAFT